MEYIFTKILNKTQKEQLRILWNREYPVNIAHHNLQDFESYLEDLSDQRHILIADHYKMVKGWYFDFLREHERWFAMIIDTEIQRKGYGSSLLKEAKKNNVELNGWVVNASDYKKEKRSNISPSG